LRKLVDRLAANSFEPFVIENEKGYNLSVRHNGDYDTNGFVDVSLSVEIANCPCCAEKIRTMMFFLVKNESYFAYYVGEDFTNVDIYCQNVHNQHSQQILKDERYIQNVLTQIANHKLYIISRVYNL